MTRDDRAARWGRRKAKRRADHNHVKGGFVGGNVRYHRANPDGHGDVTMGRRRASRN